MKPFVRPVSKVPEVIELYQLKHLLETLPVADPAISIPAVVTMIDHADQAPRDDRLLHYHPGLNSAWLRCLRVFVCVGVNA